MPIATENTHSGRAVFFFDNKTQKTQAKGGAKFCNPAIGGELSWHRG